MKVPNGLYRHFKGGEYRVLGMATHSETGEALVVYQALSDDRPLWARPAAMWFETVEHEGRKVQRFTRVEEEGSG